MYGYPITPPKSRRRSKTYWVNLFILVLAGAEMQLSFLQPLLPVNVFQLLAFLLPIVNLVLREFTDRGVGRYRPPPFIGEFGNRGFGNKRPEDFQ